MFLGDKMKKVKIPVWGWFIVLCVAVFFLALAGFKIMFWSNDNKDTAKQIKKISEEVKTNEVPASDQDEMINAPKEDTDNDYWRYMKLPLVDVDFSQLKAKNSDTVAFLKVSGTNINYPVVQTKDNDYYLTHSYDKSNNDAGWVFLDYRNNITTIDQNNIIYAHGRYDTTMFGSLKNVFKSSWYQDTENYVLYLSTPAYNSLWQIFSIYKVKTETYYLTSSFGTNESYQKFLSTISQRSQFDFKTSVNTEDKILTLSTCYNESEKVVLHAKLIKKSTK